MLLANNDSTFDPASTRLIIAPQGDVLFIVGPKKYEMRVDSHILRGTSEAFAVMLGPNFAEGTSLIDTSLKTVRLVEDDEAATAIILQALHFKFDQIPETLPAELILQIAAVADKYMLTEALRYIAEQWLDLTQHDPDFIHEDYQCTLLAAAKLFDHPRAFNKICKYMVAWFDCYDDVQPMFEVLPPEWGYKALYHIRNERIRLVALIQSKLLDTYKPWKDPHVRAANCRHRAIHNSAWLLKLHNSKCLSTEGEITLGQLLVSLRELTAPVMNDVCRTCPETASHPQPNYLQHIWAEFEPFEAEALVADFCLDCFNKNRNPTKCDTRLCRPFRSKWGMQVSK